MIRQIFTFGSGHRSRAGTPLGHCYVVITATDKALARQIMEAHHGATWAFQYNSEDEAGVERWGLHLHAEYDIDTPVAPPPQPPNTVPCGICGTPTRMTGTQRCDRCWELETRVLSDPTLALAILAREGYVNDHHHDEAKP